MLNLFGDVDAGQWKLGQRVEASVVGTDEARNKKAGVRANNTMQDWTRLQGSAFFILIASNDIYKESSIFLWLLGYLLRYGPVLSYAFAQADFFAVQFAALC